MKPVRKPSANRPARRAAALVVAALLLSSCGWRGIANMPVPGGPGTGRNAMTIYVQMPDTLALNVNSQVKVADVNVGTVRAITMKNWVATLTVGLQPDVKLPANATAKIGQTSLLGSQHVELAAPENPSRQPLRNRATIPLKNSSAYPTTERVLASIATILLGGGISNLEVITNEIYNIVNGRADQIHEFLNRLDTFTDKVNRQRDDLVRAVDSSNRLLAIVADRNNTLDRLLDEFPPLIKHFADTRDLFANAVEALGRVSKAADAALAPSSNDLHTNLQLLHPALCELSKSSPYLFGALKLLLSLPFNVDTVSKFFRGDYINGSGVIDLTLSAIDNAILSGTG
jgi:phospholipid/cholesterol/gamma-HCH transport system substrate-binding protein